MDRGTRLDRSQAARSKRRKLKNIVIECMLRKYARLRKFRRKRNK
jgi:hypothetical protein